MIRVTWRDSRLYLGQSEKSDTFEICEFKSIGFEIEDTEDHITLCRDMVDDDYRGVLVIPKENVLVKHLLEN